MGNIVVKSMEKTSFQAEHNRTSPEAKEASGPGGPCFVHFPVPIFLFLCAKVVRGRSLSVLSNEQTKRGNECKGYPVSPHPLPHVSQKIQNK